MLRNTDTADSPEWLKSLLQTCFFKYPISFALDIAVPTVSFEPYLNKIKAPILFIYGTKDRFIRQKDIDKVLIATKSKNYKVVTLETTHCECAKAPGYGNECEQFINYGITNHKKLN